MASRVPVGAQAAALAPAGLGLALLVIVVEIRMDGPWRAACCSSWPRSPPRLSVCVLLTAVGAVGFVLERGPGYLAFFVLLLFASTAAIVGDGTESGLIIDGDELAAEEPSASLVGWPLALMIATAAAAAAALRRQAGSR